MEEIKQLREEIRRTEYDLLEITPYDDCEDITPSSKDQKIYEAKGVTVAVKFYQTLKENGYSSTAINSIYEQYDLYNKEKLTRIPRKYQKKYPGKTHYYKLIETPPLKYKRVLRKLGINVEHDEYWCDLEKYC